MITKKLGSIQALLEFIQALKNDVSKQQPDPPFCELPILFRGQSNDSWELETTLERYTTKDIFGVCEYNQLLERINPAITAHTDKKWELEKCLGDPEKPNYLFTPPSYSFMTYVRHLGFPSPLLDWSESMYVALFFAYQKAEPNKDIAIYAFIETMSGTIGTCLTHPFLRVMGPYVNSHKRHFIQKTSYTVCVLDESKDYTNTDYARINYHPHKEASENCQDEDPDQPTFYKFILPGSIKHEVLAELNTMNINAFTLFSSEESLMETLAYKEIILGKGLTRG